MSSPPRIYLQISPEWTKEPVTTVHVNYKIADATEVMTERCSPGVSGIVEDNSATDEGCIGGPPLKPDSPGGSTYSGDFDWTLQATASFRMRARNEAGTTSRYVATGLLEPIGYFDARTPGPVYRSTINTLYGFLKDIDERLNRGCIRGNTALDHFTNGSYLRGELTDDILSKMKDVIIYTEPYSLPSAGRYDVKTDPATGYQYLEEKPIRLCYHDPASPNPMTGQYGFTTRDWVGICYRNYSPPTPPTPPVADAYTLLHELYHYAVREDQINWGDPQVEEARSQAITKGCW